MKWLSLDLDEEALTALQDEAVLRGCSISAVLRQVVRDHVDPRPRRYAPKGGVHAMSKDEQEHR